MKTLRILLIVALVLVGVAASVMPSLAVSHSTQHPAFTTLNDDQPTPTPTRVFQPDGPSPCSGGC